MIIDHIHFKILDLQMLEATSSLSTKVLSKPNLSSWHYFSIESIMAKKKKSNKSNKAAAGGAFALRNKNDTAGIFPYSTFEAALRMYAHPAAVADLERLTYGEPAWKQYLEAFGNSIKDLSITNYQPDFGVTESLMGMMVNRGCPLLRAFVAWKGQQFPQVLNPSVHYTLIHSVLPEWGRPLLPKAIHLRQHETIILKFQEFDHGFEKRDGQVTTMRTTSSSNRKEVNLKTSNIDWTNLTQISIKDLVLYNSHKGKFIEGKLLVEPFTPQVGTTTVFEDTNGDVIHVALYNFLPDGLNGRASIPLASKKLPMGGTVRIAEPFFKIFQDGCRGVRIDNPNDLSVVSSLKCETLNDEDRMLTSANNSGNALVKKKMYNAAGETYITGIRQADMIPTLLSNRSQAYAMLNEWDQSFADAAASLTMRPYNAKAWFRYNTALKNLSWQWDGDRRDMMTLLLRLEIDKPTADPRGKDASTLKDAGNAAFKNKQFNKAVEYYTSALLAHGEPSRALLSNWALCCIRNNANLDALSAAFASMRIRHEAKAVTRLAKSLLRTGEPELCRVLLTNEALVEVIKGSNEVNERYELLESVQFASDEIELVQYSCHTHMQPVMSPLLVSQKHLPAWIGPIESFHTGDNKGRGVRATKDILAGQVLLIEPPLAMSETSGNEECFVSIDSSIIKDQSQVYLRQAIILRSQRECVLSRIVDCLSDGVNQRGVIALKDLIPNLASCKLLLPTHYDYMKEEAKLELTPDRVDAIVNMNSFGDGTVADRIIGSVSSRLVPATSLFNHSKHPSCFWSWNGGCSIVFAVKNVKAGEELTICYHPDEEAIRRHWRIDE